MIFLAIEILFNFSFLSQSSSKLNYYLCNKFQAVFLVFLVFFHPITFPFSSLFFLSILLPLHLPPPPLGSPRSSLPSAEESPRLQRKTSTDSRPDSRSDSRASPVVWDQTQFDKPADMVDVQVMARMQEDSKQACLSQSDALLSREGASGVSQVPFVAP